MSTDALRAARALRATIDANAVRAGTEPVPKETVQALTEANLWGVMTPRELGGSEIGSFPAPRIISPSMESSYFFLAFAKGSLVAQAKRKSAAVAT